MRYMALLVIGVIVIGLLLLVHKIRREIEFDREIKAKLSQDDSEINT